MTSLPVNCTETGWEVIPPCYEGWSVVLGQGRGGGGGGEGRGKWVGHVEGGLADNDSKNIVNTNGKINICSDKD